MRNIAFALVLVLGVAPAAAEDSYEPHCHVQVDMLLYDWPDHKTQRDCKAAGGRWRKHWHHCHSIEPGPPKHLDGASDEATCYQLGGQWVDWGHRLDI